MKYGFEALVVGHKLINEFDTEMNKKKYTWDEVKVFISNTSDSADKEFREWLEGSIFFSYHGECEQCDESFRVIKKKIAELGGSHEPNK